MAVYQHPLELLAAVELTRGQPAAPVPSPPKPAYSVEEIRKHHHKAYQRWTEEDDQLLLDLHDDGQSLEELATALGRQTGGIRSRLTKLGVDVDEPPEVHDAAAVGPAPT
ncbi:hypothetical protein [Streptacidiphilus fuscans]|uniref:Uncharacterized protein n=1 Tax=Streptacidiphilus fuscans TaxID=2789292 RepID=A0A931BGU1_9ACTN|nr:hypothetical protein [Streptacidiphilus fuscans]MBF9073913.1 hypothetical protein [Streptacidiphilus fuscans]